MTNILDLAEQARLAGLHVKIQPPAEELPDTDALLGTPLDSELAELLRVANGCQIASLTIYGAAGSPNTLIGMNRDIRAIRDDIPLLGRVLLCAGFGYQATNLATVPNHTDEKGRQPVVIVDTNEEPFMVPLASTVNRALELVVEDDIRRTQDEFWSDEPFPENLAERIAQDVRLMELINAGAFADIDGGTEDLQEWCELLRGLAGRR